MDANKTNLRYHHIGIPTDIPREGEEYLEKVKMYDPGYETSPYEGVRVAFIEDNGAPIEFLHFDKPESEVW